MNHWQHIPAELRERPQWAVAGADKAPRLINGQHAKVTDPTTWTTFDQASTVAWNRGLHIGYMLSANDPLCVIDLDWCDAESQVRKGKNINPAEWSTDTDAERYWRIVQGFDSYTERSTYGKGLHIFVRANIGVGCHQQGVEVYSQKRFIICTGDVVHDRPIEDRQQLVETMVSDLRQHTLRNELVEVGEVATDIEIIERAMKADNGTKFGDLYRGDWLKYRYPSQSEADLALMSMFAFYTASNVQVRRLFRATPLGKRDKAVQNNKYLNYTLGLIRSGQADQASDNIAERMADRLIARLNAKLRGRTPPA